MRHGPPADARSAHQSGLTAGRASAYDGGFREQPSFEIWIVPEVQNPETTPTIDRKEIVFQR